jgi:hypothetical protein
MENKLVVHTYTQTHIQTNNRQVKQNAVIIAAQRTTIDIGPTKMMTEVNSVEDSFYYEGARSHLAPNHP